VTASSAPRSSSSVRSAAASLFPAADIRSCSASSGVDERLRGDGFRGLPARDEDRDDAGLRAKGDTEIGKGDARDMLKMRESLQQGNGSANATIWEGIPSFESTGSRDPGIFPWVSPVRETHLRVF
jgi:hypothetical protein